MNRVLKFPTNFAEKLEETLQRLGFEKEENPNVVFSYRGKDLKVVFYPTGTLLLQGKGDIDRLVAELVSNLEVETDYIGTDEAGKGDLFGPLVVCGFALTKRVAKEVLKLGVRDSKGIPPESLEEIAKALIALNHHRCVVMLPESYNKIYKLLQNLNKILSLAHANVIDALFLEFTLTKAVVDRFMRGSYLDCYVNAPVKLVEEIKAERYPAVAAASVIARYYYNEALKKLSRVAGTNLPAGSGEEAKRVMEELRAKFDRQTLGKFAKLHFKV